MVLSLSGSDVNLIRLVFGKMWWPSRTFSDINVQKVNVTSALELFAVLLLLLNLRYGFLNSGMLYVGQTMLCCTKWTFDCRHVPQRGLPQARKCCTAVRHSVACGGLFFVGSHLTEHVEHA